MTLHTENIHCCNATMYAKRYENMKGKHQTGAVCAKKKRNKGDVLFDTIFELVHVPHIRVYIGLKNSCKDLDISFVCFFTHLHLGSTKVNSITTYFFNDRFK